MTNFLFLLLIITKEESIILSYGFMALFFLILLISGVRKTYKLREENRQLMESINLKIKERSEAP